MVSDPIPAIGERITVDGVDYTVAPRRFSHDTKVWPNQWFAGPLALPIQARFMPVSEKWRLTVAGLFYFDTELVLSAMRKGIELRNKEIDRYRKEIRAHENASLIWRKHRK